MSPINPRNRVSTAMTLTTVGSTSKYFAMPPHTPHIIRSSLLRYNLLYLDILFSLTFTEQFMLAAAVRPASMNSWSGAEYDA